MAGRGSGSRLTRVRFPTLTSKSTTLGWATLNTTKTHLVLIRPDSVWLRGEFKDDAVAVDAAEDGAAVEVTFLVDCEIASGNAAVVKSTEAVQHAVFPVIFPSGRELVEPAATVRAPAAVGDTVEVASLVHDHTGAGEPSLASSLEGVHRALFPVAVALGCEFEHYASVGPAIFRCSIQCTCAVHEQRSAPGPLPIATVKTAQDGLFPAAPGKRRQFVDGAAG